MRLMCMALTILCFVQLQFGSAAFALIPKPYNFTDCADQLVEHFESNDGHYIPLKRAAAVLAVRPRATLLVRASLDHMVGGYDQLQNVRLTRPGVQTPAELRFVGGGYFYFVVAGTPGSLLDFTAALPAALEVLHDPRGISFQVLDTDFLAAEALDFSVVKTPYVSSFRSQPPERPQRVELDGMRDPLVVISFAQIQSLLESRELMALVDIVVRETEQHLDDARPQFAQKLKGESPFILRARDQVLVNTAAWTALLRLRGLLALTLPVANSALRTLLAGCLGTTCSPDFVREILAPTPTAAPKVITVTPESAAPKVTPATPHIFSAQISVSAASERALVIISDEQETMALNQMRYGQQLRDPTVALKARLAELYRGKIKDQLAMDRQILELAPDWANMPEDLAGLADADKSNKRDLETSAIELKQLLLGAQKSNKPVTLQINGKRSLGNPEVDVTQLVNIYKNLAQQMGWALEVSVSPEAGRPQAVLVIQGEDALGILKLEVGPHRFFSNDDNHRWTRYVDVKLSSEASQSETPSRDYIRDYGIRATDALKLAQAKITDLSQQLRQARTVQAWEILHHIAGVP